VLPQAAFAREPHTTTDSDRAHTIGDSHAGDAGARSVGAMLRRRPLLLVVLAVALAPGCGGGATGTAPDPPLPPAPRHVVARCEALQTSRRIPVLCPHRLPPGRWVVNHRTLRNGACQYLVDLETRPFGIASPFHVLAGGRCGPWPMATRQDRWPADVSLQDDLGLVGTTPLTPGESARDQRYVRLRVIRRAHIAGHPALVLATAPYPNGGVHGGHTVAIWNQRGNGYTLTMHFRRDDRRTAARRIALLLRAADAMAD
jgi:hypothetical protein